MGYYDFPHTRNYDTDLGYLIDWFKTNKNKIEENTAVTIEKALTATEDAIKAYNSATSASNSATSASNSAALALELKNQTEALKNLMQNKIEQIDTNTNRINNLATIAQGSITTTADAELVDIRVGGNGITYSSAGDSVRGQVSEIKGGLDFLLNDNVIGRRHYGLVDLQLENGLLTDNGTWNTDSNYEHTQLISVSNKDTIFVGHTLDGIETILCAYNNGVFVKTIKKNEMTLADNFYSLTFENINFNQVRANFYIGTHRQIVYFDNPTKYVDLENTNKKISKDNIISVNQDSLDGVYKQGLVFTPIEKINGFIGNRGNYVIDNNYSHSPLIKCKNGDTIYSPFFTDGLNTFFAILYKDNKFVGVLDGTNSKISPFIGDVTYYVHKINTDIDFDSIVLNMGASTNKAYINYVNDNNFYINTKTPNISSRWSNKNIYVIGDSLTAAGIWYTVLEQRYNAHVTARGISGRGIQQFIDGATDVEGHVFPPLTSDDLKDQDLIIVFGGYNNRNYPFGQVGDTPSGGTIAGLVGYVIESINNLLIQGNNNHCSLIWVTPHAAGSYSAISEDAYTEYPAGSGHNLLDQAELMEKQSNYYSTPCLNLCKNGGINKYNWNVYSANENDKVHLNYNGYIHIGNIIADFINSI